MRAPAAVGALALSLLLAAGPGRADSRDRAATLVAGGLEIDAPPAVGVEAMEVRISTDMVRIRYRLRNDAPGTVAALLRFPFPPWDHRRLDRRRVAFPEIGPGDDFLGFSASVAGRTVDPEFRARAEIDGRDVTPLLGRMRLLAAPKGPIAPRRLDSVSKRDLSDLEELGLVADGAPQWTDRAEYRWTAEIPGGRIVVADIAYRPSVGAIRIARAALGPDREIGWPGLVAPFCLDGAAQKDIVGMLPNERTTVARAIRFELVGGGRRPRPIRRFMVTLERGDPTRVMSACLGPWERVDSVNMRMTAENVTPDRDLDVLFVESP